MKPRAQSRNVLLIQLPLPIQHLGHNAARPKHIHQILLQQRCCSIKKRTTSSGLARGKA